MCAQILNSIGLILSIIGTGFVFKWGLSRQTDSFGLALGENTPIDTKWGKITVKEAEKKEAEEMAEFRCLSKIGLLLIGIGFVFQLIATWIPTNIQE
jgi:preprotein translocase subunit Sss1